MHAKHLLATVRVAAFVALTAFLPRAASAIATPIRITAYNTALMSMKMDVIANVPPFVFPLTYNPNNSAYGGQPYQKRVELIADAIKADDPDVVVLNEVWNTSDRAAFVDALATHGDYDAYVKTIKGPVPGFGNPFAEAGLGTTIDILARFLGSPLGPGVLAAVSPIIGPLVGLPPVQILGIDVKYNDSGLMLFSKKPFVPFTNPSVPFDPQVTVEGSNFGVAWGGAPGQVAAHVFANARGMDQISSKAVGLVRVVNGPASIVDVAFSHTNADEAPPLPSNADVRAAQMAEARQLFLDSLTPAELKTDQVFFLGDLNTPGSNKAAGQNDEWAQLYGAQAAQSPHALNPGVFFACGDGPCTATAGAVFDPNGSFFTDTWGFETSVKDLSDTNYVDQNYLDYVLHSRPLRQCVQHIRIGSEMVDDKTFGPLSDHLPVHVDVNLVAPQCSPNEADPSGPRIVQPNQTTPVLSYTVNDGARIAHPGNMQWYKLPDPGTYWINIMSQGDHVGYDVYRDSNLSDPIQPYHGEHDDRKGERFVSDTPLYVRVYARNPDGSPDRAFTGNYVARFQRSMGATPDDSIAISPATKLRYDWVQSAPDQGTVWFDIYTNQVGNSGFATSSIVNQSFQNGVVDKQFFTTRLFVLPLGADPYNINNYVQLPLGSAKDWHDPSQGPLVTGFAVKLEKLKGQPNGLGGFDPKKHYLAVSKDPFLGQPAIGLHTDMLFLTNLTYVSLNFMTDIEPLEGSAEWLDIGVRFDKKGALHCLAGGQACSWVKLAKGGTSPIPGIRPLQGPFRQEARVTAWIADSKNGSAEAIGLADNGSKIFPLDLAPQNPGTPEDKCRNGDLKNRGTCWKMYMSRPYDGPYHYLLEYGLSHDLPVPMP